MAQPNETHEILLDNVIKLSESVGATNSLSRADGVAVASVNMLSKMISKFDPQEATVKQMLRTLQANSPDKDKFMEAYEALRSSGVRELDRYCMVLARIVSDPEMLHFTSAASPQPEQAREGESVSDKPPSRGGGEGGGTISASSSASSLPRRSALLAQAGEGDKPQDEKKSWNIPEAHTQAMAQTPAAYYKEVTQAYSALTGHGNSQDSERTPPRPIVRTRSVEEVGEDDFDDLAMGHSPPPSESAFSATPSTRGNPSETQNFDHTHLTGIEFSPSPTPQTIKAQTRDVASPTGPITFDNPVFTPSGASDPTPLPPQLLHEVSPQRKPGKRPPGSDQKPSSAHQAVEEWEAVEEGDVSDDLVQMKLGGGGGGRRRRLQEGVHYPTVPGWCKSRIYLTGAHLIQGMGSSARSERRQLSSFPPHLQEILLMDDLLYVMLGIEGKYIRAKPAGKGKGSKAEVAFEVDRNADASLAELVGQFLPLCNAHVAAQQFVELRSNFEWGLVNHALAASIRTLLQDWQTLVAQLESQLRSGRLSLQGMWFHTQPCASALTLLAELARAATGGPAAGGGAPAHGAQLLNLLHHYQEQLGGDREAQAVLARLVKAASVPYCRALTRWLTQGTVHDPYDEFLIVQKTELRKESLSEDYNATYWQQRYTLRSEVPHFLQSSAEIILTTGKYLNAVRECGRPVPRPLGASAPIQYDPQKRTHVERIEAAFQFSSSELLGLLRGEFNLLARLRSIKHYFLLDQGDFLVHFVDIASGELEKPSSDISLPRLQSLLELSLRLSAASNDPHLDQLVCALEPTTIIQQLLSIFTSNSGGAGPESQAQRDKEGTARLRGFDTFTLDYKAPWPVSLVLSRRALVKYQLLFRHQFHCKHVERHLCRTWHLHQTLSRRVSVVGGVLTSGYCLCGRMLHFVQNFAYYMTVEVLEPNWAHLEASLAKATTIDQVIQHHEEFLDACMKESMLFWPKILRRLEKLKLLCLQFVAVSDRLLPRICPPLDRAAAAAAASGEKGRRPKLSPQERREQLKEQTEHARKEAKNPDFVQSVRTLEEQFHKQLRDLISMLNMSSHLEPNLASLCARLDFNDFFR